MATNTQFNIRLDAELIEAIKRQAFAEGVQPSDITTAALLLYLARPEQKAAIRKLKASL